MLFGERGIEIKSPDQIAKMRVAGLLVGRTLELIREAVRPGVTTGSLDALAEDTIRSGGGIPSFLGYGYPPFPATICASVNDEVVHGIPGPRELREGDLVSIDCGAIVDGWHGDAAVTVPVGDVAPELLALSQVTRDSLVAGIAAAQPGARVGDVGRAVSGVVEAAAADHRADYGVVIGYTGHGIGTAMHMPPDVPNYGRSGTGPVLQVGMAIAIEPMVTLGDPDTDVLADDWTVVASSGSIAAHWEHTVAITEAGPWVLTAHDGGDMLTGDPLA